MSFFGKDFKKTGFENVDELLDAVKAPEKVRQLVKATGTTSTFKKNDDGSIQYVVSKDGTEVFTQKMTPGEDSDFITPDGVKTKIKLTVKDNAIESVITFPDGNKLHMHRVFEGNTMKHIVWKDGVDVKGITHYEVVSS